LFREREVGKQTERPKRGYLLGITNEAITLRVVYSDESGVGNIEKEPITVVTAIVVNMDRDWDAIEKDLNLIRLDAPDALLEQKRVLKGRKFYSLLRKDAENQQKSDHVTEATEQIAREAVEATRCLHRIFGVLIKYRIPIFYGAVDRRGLINYQKQPTIPNQDRTATSYDIAFAECLGRLDSAAWTFTDERLLWIADRSDSQREPATKSGLAFYQSQQVTAISRQLGKSEDLGRISVADTIYFGHSSDSVALQLADVCCSTITNYLLEAFYDWTYSATSQYWIIRRQVMNDGTPVLLK
jgi:hypothetical protein